MGVIVLFGFDVIGVGWVYEYVFVDCFGCYDFG